MVARILLLAGLTGLANVAPVRAQAAPPAGGDTIPLFDVPKSGSEFWIPFGSMLLPGLGQYMHGAPWTGVAFSATALAGGLVARRTGVETLELPVRSGRDKLAYEAGHVAVTAGLLSAWDSFRRATPALRRAGKYDFLDTEEGVGDLMTAPLDFRFLARWTTWVDLAFTGVVLGYAIARDDDGPSGIPLRAQDVGFAASLSFNAAVGEEAFFRGWLLPMLTQKLGGRFWVANGVQAILFGAAHPDAGGFAYVIGAGAIYNGWLTRRNGWSVRESIFQHFWYDVAVVTASFLRDDGQAVSLLPLRISF